MGPKDLERIEDNKAERLEERENKSNRRFEELKNEKIAEKFGKKEQFTDEAMIVLSFLGLKNNKKIKRP